MGYAKEIGTHLANLIVEMLSEEGEVAPLTPKVKGGPRSQPYAGPFPRGKHSHRCKSCQERNGQGSVACYKSHCTRPQLNDTCSWCTGGH